MEGAGGDIHCGFTPCISDLKTQEPPASGKLLKALAKLCIKCAIMKHTKGTIALSQSDELSSS